MRRILSLCLALVLAACASSGPQPAPAPPPAPPPPAPAPAPRPSPPAPPPPPRASTPPRPSAPDTCGANALQHLIGRPRTEIPVPVDPSRRRVVCDTCPMTRDFRPDRLTIIYSAETGRVTKLMCE